VLSSTCVDPSTVGLTRRMGYCLSGQPHDVPGAVWVDEVQTEATGRHVGTLSAAGRPATAEGW
jgi:hypothetical protein